MCCIRVLLGGLCSGAAFLGALACGGGVISQRFHDEPAGVTHELGAPRNTVYAVEVETQKDLLRVYVYEQSECEKIRVQIVARTEETLRDGEVVRREPVGPVQVAEGSDGVVVCAQRFARNARVALQVGTATHALGRANPLGEVVVNLSARLQQSLYGEATPQSATLLVEGEPVATLSLTELAQHEERVNQLLGEFEALLAKNPEALTPAEIARSYELYAQLRQLDRGDARIAGLSTRFLELLYGRQEQMASENLKRNLAALKEVRDIVAMGASGIPMFVQIAAQGGELTPAALRWARGQVALSLRTQRNLCAPTFSWGRLSSGSWPLDTRFAFSYLRFAYDDPFDQQIIRLCQRFP